jgi:hypothetical protein
VPGPGQRYPSLRETTNLVGSALRARLGRTVAGLLDSRWVQAATAVALLAAIGMFLLRLGPFLTTVTMSQLALPVLPHYGLVEIGRFAAWPAVLLAAFAGARRLAAIGAWTAVLAEVVISVTRYPVDPVPVVYGTWPLVLAVMAAATLTVSAPPRHGLSVLGWRRLTLIALAVAITLAASLFDQARWSAPDRGSPFPALYVAGRVVGYDTAIGYLVATLLVLIAVLSLAAPVRRRVLALLAPVPATLTVLHVGYSGWAASSPRFVDPVLLVPAQWVILVATPVLTFLVGVALVRRREQVLRLVELGRDVDREARPIGE